MPTYHVAHKVRTVAELYEPQTAAGFSLLPFAPDVHPAPDAWEVIEVLEAPDFLTAFNGSRSRLLALIDAMAAVTQCAFSLVGTSFLVYRLTDNPDRVLYFRHLRDRRTVGMTLWRPEQMEDVTTLMRIESPAALRYFREAMNAATTSACLAMLVTTAEAFAGQTAIVGRCTQCGHEYQYGGTDRATLAAVLGENAYDQLYKKSHGSLRNRLLHGNPIDENIAAMLCGEIYERVLAYLVRTLGLKAIEHIEGAPRRFEQLRLVWCIPSLHCNGSSAVARP